MLNLFFKKPQDIVSRAVWLHGMGSLSVRRFATPLRPLLVTLSLLAVSLIIPETAFATIATDASAAGWAGVQGKLHGLFSEGIAPIATYTGMGVGVVTMAATDKPVLKGVGAGLAGLALMVSAGPGIMQTISGTAIF